MMMVVLQAPPLLVGKWRRPKKGVQEDALCLTLKVQGIGDSGAQGLEGELIKGPD